jgi:hypothetical protein
MKRLLFIFALIIFAACEKDKPQCYVCQWQTFRYDVLTETINIEKCDVTPDEIFTFEDEKTDVWYVKETSIYGTVSTVRYESTCDCVLEP